MRRHCFFDVHLKFEISYSQLQTLKLIYFLQVGESSLAKGFVEDPNHKVGLLYPYLLYTAHSTVYVLLHVYVTKVLSNEGAENCVSRSVILLFCQLCSAHFLGLKLFPVYF
jgi:hypothetical protein